MGLEYYISEDEAMTLSGVSSKTLERFSEAGYLSVERDGDGLRLYSPRELETVFSIEIPNSSNDDTDEAEESVTAETEPQPTAVFSLDDIEVTSTEIERGKEEECSVEPTPHKSTPHQSTPQRNFRPSDEMKISDSENNNRNETVVAEQEQPQPVMTEAKPQIQVSPVENEEPLQQPNVSNRKLEEKVKKLVKKLTSVQSEKNKVQKINDVYEKIIELREEQLKELRTERDWLRNQVEKLEEKSSRDQVLLLSETQLLREFLEQSQKRRSPVRAALEWLGFSEPEQREAPAPGKIVLANEG